MYNSLIKFYFNLQINDNEPIFDQSFYNVSVAEDTPVGTCLLQLSATDTDCGLNAMVNYTLELSSPMMLLAGVRTARAQFHTPESKSQQQQHQHQHEQLQLFDHFHLDSITGQLCIKRLLDFELISVYDLPVLATDRGTFCWLFFKQSSVIFKDILILSH